MASRGHYSTCGHRAARDSPPVGTQVLGEFAKRAPLERLGEVVVTELRARALPAATKPTAARSIRALAGRAAFVVALLLLAAWLIVRTCRAAGLGTVTPLATVTVRSQISGQIVGLPFREGQLVKRGDPLVEIDPRPYQVALEQARGDFSIIALPRGQHRPHPDPRRRMVGTRRVQ